MRSQLEKLKPVFSLTRPLRYETFPDELTLHLQPSTRMRRIITRLNCTANLYTIIYIPRVYSWRDARPSIYEGQDVKNKTRGEGSDTVCGFIDFMQLLSIGFS